MSVKKSKYIQYFSESDQEFHESTVKDKFWEGLSEGKVVFPNVDLYSSIKTNRRSCRNFTLNDSEFWWHSPLESSSSATGSVGSETKLTKRSHRKRKRKNSRLRQLTKEDKQKSIEDQPLVHLFRFNKRKKSDKLKLQMSSSQIAGQSKRSDKVQLVDKSDERDEVVKDSNPFCETKEDCRRSKALTEGTKFGNFSSLDFSSSASFAQFGGSSAQWNEMRCKSGGSNSSSSSLPLTPWSISPQPEATVGLLQNTWNSKSGMPKTSAPKPRQTNLLVTKFLTGAREIFLPKKKASPEKSIEASKAKPASSRRRLFEKLGVLFAPEENLSRDEAFSQSSISYVGDVEAMQSLTCKIEAIDDFQTSRCVGEVVNSAGILRQSLTDCYVKLERLVPQTDLQVTNVTDIHSKNGTNRSGEKFDISVSSFGGKNVFDDEDSTTSSASKSASLASASLKEMAIKLCQKKRGGAKRSVSDTMISDVGGFMQQLSIITGMPDKDGIFHIEPLNGKDPELQNVEPLHDKESGWSSETDKNENELTKTNNMSQLDRDPSLDRSEITRDDGDGKTEVSPSGSSVGMANGNHLPYFTDVISSLPYPIVVNEPDKPSIDDKLAESQVQTSEEQLTVTEVDEKSSMENLRPSIENPIINDCKKKTAVLPCPDPSVVIDVDDDAAVCCEKGSNSDAANNFTDILMKVELEEEVRTSASTIGEGGPDESDDVCLVESYFKSNGANVLVICPIDSEDRNDDTVANVGKLPSDLSVTQDASGTLENDDMNEYNAELVDTDEESEYGRQNIWAVKETSGMTMVLESVSHNSLKGDRSNRAEVPVHIQEVSPESTRTSLCEADEINEVNNNLNTSIDKELSREIASMAHQVGGVEQAVEGKRCEVPPIKCFTFEEWNIRMKEQDEKRKDKETNRTKRKRKKEEKSTSKEVRPKKAKNHCGKVDTAQVLAEVSMRCQSLKILEEIEEAQDDEEVRNDVEQIEGVKCDIMKECEKKPSDLEKKPSDLVPPRSWTKLLEGRRTPSLETMGISTHSLKQVPSAISVSHLDNEGIKLAVKKNDLRVMERVVASITSHPNWDLEQPDAGGDTLLMLAASNDANEMIILLYKSRVVNLNAKNSTMRTAMMIASCLGHIRSVSTLVELGAFIDVRDFRAKTALLLAIENNRDQVVHYLLGKGANFCPLTLTSCNYVGRESERAARINGCLNYHVSAVTKCFDVLVMRWVSGLGYSNLKAIAPVQFMTPKDVQKFEFVLSYRANESHAGNSRHRVLFCIHCNVEQGWMDGKLPAAPSLVLDVKCNRRSIPSLNGSAFLLTQLNKGYNAISVFTQVPDPTYQPKLAFRAYDLTMPHNAILEYVGKYTPQKCMTTL